MSQVHSGNAVPDIEREEHDGIQYAKKVSLVSAATVYAVVNTSAPGVQNSMATLFPGPNFIGLVTNVPGSGTTLYPSPNYIGLATIDIGTQNKVGITGNVTLSDPKGFVGLVTLGGGTAWTDPKTFIGMTTAVNGQAWPDPKTYIGLVTVANQVPVNIVGNVTLSDPKTYIGLITVGGIGTVTLADPKGFIGLVTIGGTSLITLGDSKGYIGLVTATVVGISSLYTSFASIVSASGLATIINVTSGKITVIKDLYVSSLGRAEVSWWGVSSGASQLLIPWTALSTTAGYIGNFGDSGLNAGGASWGLTINLNGAATVGYMVNAKFV